MACSLMQVLAYRICCGPRPQLQAKVWTSYLQKQQRRRGRPTFSSLHRKALADSTSHTSRLRGLETQETLQLWPVSPNPAL